MAKYIKSHSNYVLKTKHQNTYNGTVFERDITTIGGKDQFARNQVPIYKSGNFIITVNGDNNKYKKSYSKPWYENESGKIWNHDILKNYEKSEKTSYDKKLVIKNDYFDLRDFAYYGSCSELIRASITDILKKYPGELYNPYKLEFVGNDGDYTDVQYTKEAAISAFGEGEYMPYLNGLHDVYTSFDEDFYRDVRDRLPEEYKLTDDEKIDLEKGIPLRRRYGLLTDGTGKRGLNGDKIEAIDAVIMDNPFGINIHDKYVPKGENPLKYFAEDGIKNYVAYKYYEGDCNGDYEAIEERFYDGHWDFENEYEIEVISTVFNGLENSESADVFFGVDNSGNCGSNCADSILVNLTAYIESTVDYCLKPGKYVGYIELGFRKIDYSFKTIPPGTDNINTNDCESCDNGLAFDGDKTSEKNVTVNSYVINDINKDDTLKVYLFVGEDYTIKYFVENFSQLSDGSDCKPSVDGDGKTDNRGNFIWRIRPRKRIINDFFEYELDNFEKLLLNRNSDPIYTSYFEIVDENDFGYFTTEKPFTFPTTYGGYNLGSSGPLYLQFVNELSKIADFYDERFSDNLWRSMTHESIKNFDWTYTRHFAKEEEEPFIEGGNKIQKIIRLFGREFDEIKNYSDAIKDNNNVTYDNASNLPDYFFTDKLEDYGWDVNSIKPLVLSEYVNELDGTTTELERLFCYNKVYVINDNGELVEGTIEDARKHNVFYLDNDINRRFVIKRNFIDNFDDVHVIPYSRNNITGVRITSYVDPSAGSIPVSFDFPESDGDNCLINGASVGVNFKTGEEVINGYHNDCGDLIRIYSDENSYTPSDVETEFMKRLILNSKELWKHKGTIDGMEMLLAMFGMKSKRSVFKDERYFKCYEKEPEDEDPQKLYIQLTDTSGNTWIDGKTYYGSNDLNKLYDYDIKEYSMFTTYIADDYLSEKDMFRIDWINSKKMITYNTEDFKNGVYVSYQGLPVSYKNIYGTNEENEEVVLSRELYPHFETTAIYDGNPYYQMNGGWLQKRPFAFDIDNNILVEDTDSNSRASKGLFTETVRNIHCVNNLQGLFMDSTVGSKSGDVIQVLDLSGRYAIVDGIVYPLTTEYNDNYGSSYFYVNVTNNSLVIGKAIFSDYVIISNPYVEDNKQRIDLSGGYYDNKRIKVYVIKDEETGKYTLDAYSNDETISTFTMFENGKYMDGDNYTNYFKLNDPDFKNELSIFGWQQLKNDEFEYYKLNTIESYNKGNNPHYGHMKYDNGHEYLTYFNQLFKYSINNDLLDYRQFNGNDYDILDEVIDENNKIIRDSYTNIGFKNLLNSDDDCDIDYDKYLRLDNKCHYFGSFIERQKSDKYDKKQICDAFKKRELPEATEETAGYKITDIIRSNYLDVSTDKVAVKNLNYGKINTDTLGEDGLENNEDFSGKINSVTDQIVNTKRMEIDFFIKYAKEYTKEWLEEVKYIDSIILPYLTQMMPSGVICRVNYKTLN